MKHISVSILFFILIINITNYSQQITDWQNYTDMKSVQSLVADSSGVWGATGGGAFYYNAITPSFKTLHKTDGLLGTSLSAITIDKYGKIWFGSNNGIIDIYNPSTKTFNSILDIFNSNIENKSITDLVASGDTIIVSTDYGISLINSKKLFFYDTFFRFGNLPSNTVVNAAKKIGLIYACTIGGIAIQKKGAVNLLAPDSWNLYTTADGLPSNNVRTVIKFNDNIIAATDKGLSIFTAGKWQQFIPQLNNRKISDLITIRDTLFIISNATVNNSTLSTIYAYSNGKLNTINTSNNISTELTYSNKIGLLSSTSKGIFWINNAGTTNSFLFPNGPKANQFPNIAVDNNGNLWSASGRDVTGIGYYEFNGNIWKNHNMINTPGLSTNALYVVFASPDNTIYFGSWGEGFVRIKNKKVQSFDRAVTGMNGIIVNPDFLVITGFAIDSRNDVWILNYGSTDKKPLTMLTPDSTWYHFSVPATSNLYLAQFFNLVIDQSDTKWFSSQDPNKSGLYYFNENKTFNNPNDDKSGYLTTSNGLNSNTINALAVDRRGDIWVGTNLGVNIISNTYTILQSGTPQFRITSVFSLREQIINCIAVDALNRKWVGTNQGLFLVNSDGSSLLATYNTSNSPLLSNQIKSIAIDNNTGKVYVGTGAGLTSFYTAALKPVENFTKLFIYPSPFVLKNGNNHLTIDGLVRNSEIKVLTISGRLIKEFSSPGGRVAYWNGRDKNGNLVNSGIYLIVAYDSNGNNVITGKIAVLHR